MKQLALVAFIFVSLSLNAQKLYMKSGEFTPQENIQTVSDFANWTDVQYGKHSYCILQFSGSTSPETRKSISKETGIEFQDYLPKYAFIAAVPKSLNVSELAKFQIRSILPFEAKYKIAPKLMQRPFPTWMDRGNGRVEVLVSFHKDLFSSKNPPLINNQSIQLKNWMKVNQAIIELNESQLNELASYPYVKFIEATSAPVEYDNLTERSNHRVNTIDASYVTGLHYDGTGVSVAVGDDGLIGPHIDFQGRITNHTGSNSGTHADHVCGIVAGGGNFDPITSGNARGSSLHIYSNYGNLNNAPTHYATEGVRITSNSLGQGCNSGYNSDAQDADYLINSRFSLMSVHSAGNSGTGSCGGVPQGYYTITGGYKAGKNVIAVGNVTNSDVIAPSSSRGPSEDGRIKPEIVAVGTDVYSTQPDNSYDSFTGTSMSCPGVSGTLASLWQAYRETHAGADPYSALMKALVMNTADDLGNKGPDFIYGYGRINARRAYKAMINNQYFIDSMDNGNMKDFYINVPANVKQIKVMLYWNDFEGNPVSSVALVNDLSLQIQEPSGNVIDPWVLNNTPTVAALNSPAVRGFDFINNVEQVTLDSVFAGLCILSVTGMDVPLGPQKFILTYEYIMDSITLTYPQGGESFANGQKERVRWDAFSNTGDFTLEYSADAGTSWTTLSNSIPGDRRYFDWTPPASLNTGQMLMRISRGAYADISDTLFTVFEVTKNLMVDTACGTDFHLTWDALPFADGYTIYMMGPNSSGPNYMTEIGTSTTNEFAISGTVNTTDTFYFAVAGTLSTNGAKGLRTIAYQKLPGNVNCLDNAYNMQTILPFNEAYTCATINPFEVKMLVKNIGLRTLTNLDVHYQINANPVVNEVMPGPLAIGDSVVYTFTTLANFALPGTYDVTTWTSRYTDIVTSNDTSMSTSSVLIATTVVAPNVEDFEGPLFPPTGWRAIDPDTNVKWQKTLCLVDPTGFNSHAAYMDFFNYNKLQAIDELETVQYDLTGASADSLLLTFDVSHAYGPKDLDSLQVLVSEDCAFTYTPTTYYRGGNTLATAGLLGTIFSPTLVSQWRNDKIDLTAYQGKKIFVRFKARNGQGNNLFVDNINLMLKDAWPLGVTNIGNDNVQVYPNPSDGNYTLELNAYDNKIMKYAIYNVAGQKLKEVRIPISAGKTRVALNISNYPSGIYMLELNDGQESKKVKLTKY
ncbi:MAG: S8 family serine peptidase [Bacteroidetes bacterium]|nr:S8 family serine peptidase [Bacteroidota bacterium]